MTLIAVALTIRCDWPDCKETITLMQNEPLYDHGWGHRLGDMHVCPEHAKRSAEELIEERRMVYQYPEKPVV